MTESTSPLTRVAGFRAVGVTCGLKQSGQPDLALLVAEQPCAAAAIFTTNAFKAAPVLYDMALLERTGGKLRAVVVNAGNANAVTGEQGWRDAEQMARLTEAVCDLPPDSVFVMSTGVIGHLLPMAKVEQGIRLAAEAVTTTAGTQGRDVSQAILTTDLVKKEAFVQTKINGQLISLGGVAKGSGMIHVNMATMLSIIVTDALIEPAALTAALKQVADRTFNRVTVDGDTSTNDTLVILASGKANQTPITYTPSAPSEAFSAFCAALTDLCTQLARAIARDGEGATKLIEVTVRGALSEAEADRAGKTIATSTLLKTALFGNDPNWGRALAAVGRSGITVEPTKVSLWLGDFHLVEFGEPLEFEAEVVSQWLAENREIKLLVDLHLGTAAATVWTCDLSYKYVEINAEYHT